MQYLSKMKPLSYLFCALGSLFRRISFIGLNAWGFCMTGPGIKMAHFVTNSDLSYWNNQRSGDRAGDLSWVGNPQHLHQHCLTAFCNLHVQLFNSSLQSACTVHCTSSILLAHCHRKVFLKHFTKSSVAAVCKVEKSTVIGTLYKATQLLLFAK